MVPQHSFWEVSCENSLSLDPHPQPHASPSATYPRGGRSRGDRTTGSPASCRVELAAAVKPD